MKVTRGTVFWLFAAAAALSVIVGYAATCARIPADGFVFNDFAILNYSAEAARRFYENTGNIWGYEPHFMAGYPLSFIWNSNVATQTAARVFSSVPAASVVRAFFLAGLFSFPLLFWWALANFGFTLKESSAGLVLGGLYFLAGLPVLFFMVGMVTAGFALGVCMVALSFLYRYAEHGGAYSLTGMIVFVSLSLFVHKTTAIVLFVPGIVALWIIFAGHAETCARADRSTRAKRLAGILIAAAAAYLLNSFWINPLIANIHNMVSVPEAPFWRNYDVLLPFREYFTGVAKMNMLTLSGPKGVLHSATLCLLLAAGAAGCLQLKKQGETNLALFLILPAAALWLFAYYGAFIPGAGNLNPARYQAFAQLMLAVPGGVGIAKLANDTGKINAAGWTAAFIVAAVAIGGVIYSSEWLKPIHILLARGVSPEVRMVAEKIKGLPPGGRIMIEDSGDMDVESMGQVYGNTQIVSNFGLMTGREFIGGPYPYVFLKHRRATFFDGRAFGKAITDLRPDEMKRLLELYNVKWIVCWSDASKGYFDRYGGDFSKTDAVEQFSFYVVDNYTPSQFISGAGDVEADYGLLKVRTQDRSGGAVVIKYHWPGMYTTKPETRLEKYEVDGDPVGFIKIIDPPPELLITIP